jgi:hypothetical protein
MGKGEIRNKCAVLITLFLLIAMCANGEARDTRADTWVATDGLGRKVSTHKEVGGPRKDKFVGIFYFLWMGQHGTGGPYDITKILAADPDAMRKPDSPLWGPKNAFHHWGEPLFGYYLSDDAWVIRKHAQMLSDAGVDVIIFDVTNQITYQKVYMRLCEVFAQVRSDGGKTPQIAFLTPFWDPPKVVKELYENLYKPGLYSDLWFQWPFDDAQGRQGKPLILADKDKVDPQYRDFFTYRKPEPSYFAGPSGPNQWGWLEVYPQHIFYDKKGKPEQMTVGIGQNGKAPDRCAAFSEKDTHGRTWHNGKKDERPGAVNLGLNVAEQWERALEVDPEFIFITGWNEWIAMRLAEFNGVKEPVMFVDQYTQEYSRDIEPMRGGHWDAYYYQMVDYIRKFKGARKPPVAGSPMTIRDFGDWEGVRAEYLDDAGDTMHRDHPGYDNVGRYVNTSGRNDFTLMKVAHDSANVYFYAQTREAITPETDPNWMMLFISTGKSPGWEGYDYVVNRKVGVLEESSGAWDWHPRAVVDYHVKGNELWLAIPRNVLGLSGRPVRFDFKWADNMQANDVMEFTVNGDSAPNGRFNYRYSE